MNLKIIACKVFWREISLLTANSPHYCDVTYLRQGLHAFPLRLQKSIQDEIDEVECGNDIHTNYPPKIPFVPDSAVYDAILLCYGLCSGSIENLHASKYPLVVPRAHDCLAILLGSTERYDDYFFKNKGTYWSSVGWMDCSNLPDEAHRESKYAEYMSERGKKMADRLIRAHDSWKENYSRLAFIQWDEIECGNNLDACMKCAQHNAWDFDLLKGDSSLLKRFLGADWIDEEFLMVMPGKSIVRTYDERIVEALSVEENKDDL